MDLKDANKDFCNMFSNKSDDQNQQGANRYANLRDGRNVIRFVSRPYPERQHYLKELDDNGGTNRFVSCSGKWTCPICKSGIKSGFKYRIVGIDKTDCDNGEYKDGEIPVRFFSIPSTVAKTISEIINDDEISLLDRDFTINRSGKKFNTNYTVYPSKTSPLTQKEKEAIEAFPEPETLLRKPMSVEELSRKSYEDPNNPGTFFHGENSPYNPKNLNNISKSSFSGNANNFSGSENSKSSFDDSSWDNFN